MCELARGCRDEGCGVVVADFEVFAEVVDIMAECGVDLLGGEVVGVEGCADVVLGLALPLECPDEGQVCCRAVAACLLAIVASEAVGEVGAAADVVGWEGYGVEEWFHCRAGLFFSAKLEIEGGGGVRKSNF